MLRGFLQQPLCLQQGSKIKMRHGKVWLELQRLPVTGDSLIRFIELGIQHPKIKMELRNARVNREHLAKTGYRLPEFTLSLLA